MIGKELKHLSRRELVDIIYQLKKNEQEMQESVEALKNDLQDKRIRVSVAGSIADAAVSMTNLFSTAQMTADLYLSEVARMRDETEQECAQKIAAAEKQVANVLAEGEQQLAQLKARYNSDYARWQQLQTQIALLEEKKKRAQHEDVNHG